MRMRATNILVVTTTLLTVLGTGCKKTDPLPKQVELPKAVAESEKAAVSEQKAEKSVAVDLKSHSVKSLERLCSANNGDACFEAAVRYEKGGSDKQSEGDARRLYKKACYFFDHLEGCFRVGLLTKGPPKVLQAYAFEEFEWACLLGHKEACKKFVSGGIRWRITEHLMPLTFMVFSFSCPLREKPGKWGACKIVGHFPKGDPMFVVGAREVPLYGVKVFDGSGGFRDFVPLDFKKRDDGVTWTATFRLRPGAESVRFVQCDTLSGKRCDVGWEVFDIKEQAKLRTDRLKKLNQRNINGLKSAENQAKP